MWGQFCTLKPLPFLRWRETIYLNISLTDYELWEESDGHKFHQHQQNEQSPLMSTECAEHKKTTTYDIRNPSPVLRHIQYFGWPLSYLLTVEV